MDTPEEPSEVNSLPVHHCLPLKALQSKSKDLLQQVFSLLVFYCLFMFTIAGKTYFPPKSLFILLSNFPFQWLYYLSFSFSEFSLLEHFLPCNLSVTTSEREQCRHFFPIKKGKNKPWGVNMPSFPAGVLLASQVI